MGRVKCPVCGLTFNRDKEPNVYYKKRYYHPACYNTVDKENRDKNDLVNYICKIYNYKAPGPVINKQIKQFHDDLGYTYSGILKCLVYFYEIKNNDPKKAVGIGIVPYIWKDAQEYYYNLYLIQQKNALKEIEQNNTRTIKISKPKRSPLRKRKKISLEE